MLPISRLWFLCVAGLIVAVLSGGLDAQPIGHGNVSLEAQISQANDVLIGSIADIGEKVLIKPGEVDESGVHVSEGISTFTITVKVDEVIKGKIAKNPELRIQCSPRSARHYQRCAKTKTSGLWFLGPAPKAADVDRKWEFFSLTPLPAAEIDPHSTRYPPPMFANDLSILRTKKEILARARAYGLLSKADKRVPSRNIQSIEIPSRIGSKIQQGDGGYQLALLIEPALEKTARRMIEDPGSFFPNAEFEYQQYQDETFYHLRLAGMDLLRYFPSIRNQTLLRNRLDIPLLSLEKNGFPQLRIKAYEVLIAWDVDLQTPSFASEITAIDLKNAHPTDTILARLSELKNLSLLGLDGGQVGDAEFRSLAHFNLLHLMSHATQWRAVSRPKSASDVFGLALHEFAITDASLKEILRFENLTHLNLRGTKVTDHGLESVVLLAKLKSLDLSDCSISDDAIAKLIRMKTLTSISVRNTPLSRSGVIKLKAGLPSCYVTSSYEFKK